MVDSKGNEVDLLDEFINHVSTAQLPEGAQESALVPERDGMLAESDNFIQ